MTYVTLAEWDTCHWLNDILVTDWVFVLETDVVIYFDIDGVIWRLIYLQMSELILFCNRYNSENCRACIPNIETVFVLNVYKRFFWKTLKVRKSEMQSYYTMSDCELWVFMFTYVHSFDTEIDSHVLKLVSGVQCHALNECLVKYMRMLSI